MRGLKENVIMGRLIPAGTGMDYYRQISIPPEPVEAEPAAEEGAGVFERRLGGGRLHGASRPAQSKDCGVRP